MSLVLLEAGLQTLLVDGGRTRWRSLGVPLGGAADRAALAIGNALVGNTAETLALEFTLLGPKLRAEQLIAACVFGAPFAITVNDRPMEVGSTFSLHQGDMLRIGSTPRGVHGYLCVAGGFIAQEWLNSRSSSEPFRVGARLECRSSRCEPRSLGLSSFQSRLTDSDTRSVQELRVIPGPQADWFLDARFFEQTYEVSSATNRMGVRLKGEAIVRRSGELLSEAVAPGAVQITNDGLPVILGVDGQTIGGYPKIAHVIRADLDLAAQLRPGDKVQFVPVSAEESLRATKERVLALNLCLARLRAADRIPTMSSLGTQDRGGR